MVRLHVRHIFKPEECPHAHDLFENHYPEIGDYEFDVPNLRFGESGHVNISITGGGKSNKEDGIIIGYIKINDIICECNIKEPVYYGLSATKEYNYTLYFDFIEKQNDSHAHVLKCKSLDFLIKTILAYINLLIKEGHAYSEFNWDWINWQCTTWNAEEARGMERDFTYYANDIRNLECLYDYCESFELKGRQESRNRVGRDNRFWEEFYFRFPKIDNYISNLIGKALHTEPFFDNEFVEYKYTTNGYYAYSEARSFDLSERAINHYRPIFIKKIRIYCIKNYDFFEMKKQRFLKS